jgi:hypothetical protein
MRKDAQNRAPAAVNGDLEQTAWNLETVGDNVRAWESKSFDCFAHRDLVITGWALDRGAEAPAAGVVIIIDGNEHTAQYGRWRPDVAEFFKMPAYAPSGFVLELPAGEVPAGSHTLNVRVLARGGRRFWELGPYALNMK